MQKQHSSADLSITARRLWHPLMERTVPALTLHLHGHHGSKRPQRKVTTLTGVYVAVDVGGLEFPPTPFPATPVAVMAQVSTVCPWERPRAAPQGVEWKTAFHRVMLYRSSMTLALREVTGQKGQIASAKVSGGMDLAAAYRAAMVVLLRYERGEVSRPDLKQELKLALQ
eukprot:5284357-Amphidinium_carterae.1